MGYNTVAVLFNDHTDQIRRSGQLGERIVSAMYNWNAPDRSDTLATWFGAGQVISQDHADGYQVTVTHANSGWRIDDASMDKYLGYMAFAQMKECLERNGYKVTKRRKKNEAS